MSNNLEKRFSTTVAGCHSKSSIPKHNQSIIRAAGKNIAMHFMPRDIFNRSTMMQDLHYWCVFIVLLLILLDIPNAYPLITVS